MRALVVAAILWATPLPAQIPPAIEDPTETVGPQRCAQCHDAEHAVWVETKHAELYESDQPLHERPRAKEIADKLGERFIKHDSRCLNCHFTPTVRGSRVTAFAGVSCESCHGAADDWVTEHNFWQGQGVSRASEDPATTRARRTRMAELGMRSPGDMYALLGACYRCHMVPDERLVREGGHTSGGAFDPIERVDAIKHTFVSAESRTDPAPLSDSRKRQLYVLGQALELEMRLRLVADAEDSGYARSRSGPLRSVIRNLERIQRTVELPEVASMIQAAKGLSYEAGNADELRPAAEKVAQAARSFARNRDVGRLAELDPLLRGSLDVAEAVPLDDPFAPSPDEAGGNAGGADGDDTAGGGSPPEPGSPTTASTPGGASSQPQASYPRKSVLRSPLTQNEIVGQGQCAGCHAEQNGWWYDDAHERSMRRMENPTRRAVQIARNYYAGVDSPEQYLTRATSVCMGCHGTVVTGTSFSDSGVSCEQCHGPAGKYLQTHKDVARAQRLSLGMVDLQDTTRRAEVCASCHYVTDPRLLASGHTSGKDFDPADRLAKIQHWSGSAGGGNWPSAYAAVRSRRGPVPDVRVSALPSGGDEPVVVGGGGGRTRSTGGSTRGASNTPGAAQGADSPGSGVGPPPERPIDPEALEALRGTGGPVDLPPWPESDGLEDRPAEDILREVQKRLETLYEAIRESDR